MSENTTAEPEGLDEARLQFARECADPDWSLSIPEPAKAVIRDLLAALAAARAEVESLALRHAHTTTGPSTTGEHTR
jgi:hypothetical protein